MCKDIICLCRCKKELHACILDGDGSSLSLFPTPSHVLCFKFLTMLFSACSGHYVPNLAWEIVQGNRQDDESPINLQGFLVGNAWTDPDIDNEGAVDFWYAAYSVSSHWFWQLVMGCLRV